MRKKNIDQVNLIQNFGLENDAHGGDWHRQVSFLAQESILTMRDKGLDVVAGNFAENITTEGLDLTQLQVGTHITLGETEVIISQLGKICHTPCAIYHQAGDCVMPREGIFGVVVNSGTIKVGDSVTITDNRSKSAAIVAQKKDEITELGKLMQAAFHPAFIRCDRLSAKKGANLAAILEDLTTTQKTSNIVILDSTGELGLQLATLPLQKNGEQSFTYKGSNIFIGRDVETLKQIFSPQ